jgi:hypothetical protein
MLTSMMGGLVDIAPKEKRRGPEAVPVRDGSFVKITEKVLPIAPAMGSKSRVSACFNNSLLRRHS